ncbi:MAG: dihydrofolate reductase [Paludibacter sp.]|nr:dihydrofolate reductase [Paludibacter sp.]
MCKISIIAAVSDNYVIGKSKKLPWHLPADLKRFKQLTTGQVILMGKRTFQSLPNGPLPDRKNIVLSSTISEGIIKGYFEANSIEEALDLCENVKKVFVIGGSVIYNQCMQLADDMYITWVHSDFDGDTYFPEVSATEWKEVSREDFPADEKNPYPYSFSYYKRKK